MDFVQKLLNWLNFKNSILLIIAIGFITFFSVLFNSFVFDHIDFILGNPLIHSLSNIPTFFTYHHSSPFLTAFLKNQWGNFYRPITISFLAVTYTLSFGTPFLLYFSQILLHIANTCLIFTFFNKFFKAKLSFALALIFLVHPINVETVAISSTDLLYNFFGLLALNKIFYQKLNSSICFIPILFLLSLLSKETGGLFLIISFLGIIFYKRNYLKSFLISNFFVLLIYFVLRFVIAQPAFNKVEYNPILTAPFDHRLYSIPKIIFYYLSTIFYPNNLSVAQQWIVKNINFRDFYLPLFFDLAFFAMLIIFFILLIKNTSSKKLFSFFLFWFVLGLLPHLQIIPLATIVTNRWFYFSFIGLLGILGVIAQNIQIHRKLQNYLFLIYCLIILVFIIITNFRILNWRDNLSLFEHDLAFQKESYILLNNLGNEYMIHGRVDEAKKLFEKSTIADPNGMINWNNLANIYYQKKDFQKATDYYQIAIKNGDYELAYMNYGILLLTTNQFQDARDLMTKALSKFPLNFKLWRIFAIAEKKLGNKNKAIEAAKKANELYSDEPGLRLYQELVK